LAEERRGGGDLFIVDNSDSDWKVGNYLREWTDIATAFDIATGYFEIGALLSLDGQWQKLEKLRILMGDEVSKRTKSTLVEGVQRVKVILDESIEAEKEKNDFLTGVPAIVEAIGKKQIEARVYNKDKFHAKAYITHAKSAVVGSSALVGSSNFTFPGLTQNVELNVQLRREVELLQEWYERHWLDADDVTAEILKTIERHTRLYDPFDVYIRAMSDFFARHEPTANEWESHRSKIYGQLDQYQKEGYKSLMEIAAKHGGALLCDGVGLGKTFVGMMLIERLVDHERKRVVLFVPKAARVAVWEHTLKQYLPHLQGDFSNFVLLNHTDLSRPSEEERVNRIAEMADVVMIDEAHHFRNPGIKGEARKKPSRYRRMLELTSGKQMFMLTATPVNNRLIDLQHMIELFTQRQADYFKSTLGIHSLAGHFRKMEKDLEQKVMGAEQVEFALETDEVEAEQVLSEDALFQALVVQRSRAYVVESQQLQGATAAVFPDREPPHVAPYSVAKTYGPLLKKVERAFSREKPLFILPIYFPLAYYKGDNAEINPLEEGRQRQVVGLIRTQFLKRFESSVRAFEMSCDMLLTKLLTWVARHTSGTHEKQRLERWKQRHEQLIFNVQQRQKEISGEEAEPDEDFITDEMLEDVEELNRDDYKIDEILDHCYDDLDQLAEFLKDIANFNPGHDDKLATLVNLLQTDPVMSKHKVLIFSEYMATARYLKNELQKAGIEGVDEIDSANSDRQGVIERFAPYYNGSSSAKLAERKLVETRVLISTDVLSEGLNLQDATRLINYDLHWNPVRLMQRIGRVDRRMSPAVEEQLIADHPDQQEIRGKVAYWNFLPPDDLDELLHLYTTVTRKTLRISKTLGIETGKLLKPDDDFQVLKQFNETYAGTTTPVEEMHLEWQKLLQEYPGLEDRIAGLPGRVFSGQHHLTPGARAVFFNYWIPGPTVDEEGEKQWIHEAGESRWYLLDLNGGPILEEAPQIVDLIRSTPTDPRECTIAQPDLVEARKKIETHIKNTRLKQLDAPMAVKPVLRSWMELS
jgi:superfamily II DNA or RNA helicase